MSDDKKLKREGKADQAVGKIKQKAEKLMLQVHQDGKSAVSNGNREAMERDVEAMHTYGLWATCEKS